MQLFLADGLTGEQKAHLTNDCLRNLATLSGGEGGLAHM